MEASALQVPAGLSRSRASIGASFLRLRSDDQLVELFRAGNDEAFRVIHDRYRARLFAYTRQMLSGRQDAEDALQDVFIKAFSALRANDEPLALRAWLYRVAHNRCIDQLRRPVAALGLPFDTAAPPTADPISATEQREALKNLIADVRRLPDQQRSALLMRELSGMSYAELADALGLTVAAVKSLLVRARVTLAAADEARNTACAEIQAELVQCHDRGVRATAIARRHLHDCAACREFRVSVRGVSRQLAALTPAVGPLGAVAKLLGLGGGAAAHGGATGTGAAAAGTSVAAGASVASAGGAAAAGTGAAAAGGAIVGTGLTAGHVATLLAAAVVTAGGAVALHPTVAPSHHHRALHASAAHNESVADTVRTAAIGIVNKTAGAVAQPAASITSSTLPTTKTASVTRTPAKAPASSGGVSVSPGSTNGAQAATPPAQPTAMAMTDQIGQSVASGTTQVPPSAPASTDTPSPSGASGAPPATPTSTAPTTDGSSASSTGNATPTAQTTGAQYGTSGLSGGDATTPTSPAGGTGGAGSTNGTAPSTTGVQSASAPATSTSTH